MKRTTTATGHTEGMHSGMRHQHDPHGGPPPEGIETAADPTNPVGTTVILTADHMPGMEMTNHKWVVESEIQSAQ